MMKKSVTLLAALLMLAVAAAPAFAMTKQKAKQLGTAASKGNAAVLTHLESAAKVENSAPKPKNLLYWAEHGG